MARIQNFWDLKNITSYSSHYVDQFDVNTPSVGGGYFKWIASNNASITDIAGIRIKPSGTTDGYWLRDYSGPMQLDWFGTKSSNQTLTSLGITQGVADTRYGAGVVNVTTDKYDYAAMAFAFKLMESIGYSALEFSPVSYYLNRALNLPRFQVGIAVPEFILRGNGCLLRATAGHTGNILQRIPPDQNSALNGGYIEVRFDISGFNIIGNNATGQTGLLLGPSFNSIITFIDFTNIDRGLNLEFCLNVRVISVKGIPNEYGIMIDYGSTWGGNNSNSQSNHAQILQCRIFNVAGVTASYYIRGCSGVKLVDCIVEGFAPDYGIYFDYNGSTVVHEITIDNSHVEVACNIAAIYMRGSTGQYNVRNVFNQYSQVLVEFDCPNGYPQVNIEKVSYTHPSTTFANKNAGAVWKFVDCEFGPAPWEAGASTCHPYRSTAWKATAGYFQPTGKYSAAHALQSNYRCYVIEPILRQLTDD